MSTPCFSASQRSRPWGLMMAFGLFLLMILLVPVLAAVGSGNSSAVVMLLIVFACALGFVVGLIAALSAFFRRVARHRERRVGRLRPGAFVFSSNGLTGPDLPPLPWPGARRARVWPIPVSVSSDALEIWWLVGDRAESSRFSWPEVSSVHPGTTPSTPYGTFAVYSLDVRLIDGPRFGITLGAPVAFAWNIDPAQANSVLDAFRPHAAVV